jgi:hypothetical protein
MLSKKAIKYFKKNGYNFEEIEGIKKWMNESVKWETISNNEMKSFVWDELFSKYKMNV